MTYIPLDSPHPYHALLSYPHDDSAWQAQCRRQLQKLGVEALVAEGGIRLQGHPLLGAGYCGLVVAGVWHGQSAAIKIRRRDCRQADLTDEARLQLRANALGLGPQLWAAQGDLLVMQRLTGEPLASWLDQPTLSGKRLQALVLQLLQQGFSLDQAGIDHGALRYPSDHALVVDDRVTLIDFSHASDRRRPNNVTSLVQALGWGTRIAEQLGPYSLLPQREEVLPLLRHYKQHPDESSFAALLQGCRLCTEKL